MVDTFKLAVLTKARHGDLHAFKERHGTLANAAAALGISLSRFHKWYTLRAYPEYTEQLETLFREHLGKSWAALWPVEVREQIDRLRNLNITLKEECHYQEVPLARLGNKAARVPAIGYEDPSAGLARQELATRLEHVLKTLSDRERKVIRCRWFEHLTLEETGRVLKVSRARVHQLELKALWRLRAKCGDEFADFMPAVAGQLSLRLHDEERERRAQQSLQEIVDARSRDQ